jgi:hypothetical protein
VLKKGKKINTLSKQWVREHIAQYLMFLNFEYSLFYLKVRVNVKVSKKI